MTKTIFWLISELFAKLLNTKLVNYLHSQQKLFVFELNYLVAICYKKKFVSVERFEKRKRLNYGKEEPNPSKRNKKWEQTASFKC